MGEEFAVIGGALHVIVTVQKLSDTLRRVSEI